LASQPADQASGRVLRHVETATDGDGVVALELDEIRLEVDGDAVRAEHPLAPLAQQLPRIELAPGLAIRQPQGLDRAGEGQEGELRQQDEGKAADTIRGEHRTPGRWRGSRNFRTGGADGHGLPFCRSDTDLAPTCKGAAPRV